MSYRLIYLDPPWLYRQGGRGAATNHYQCQPMGVIAQHIEVHGQPDPAGASLACWQTWPMEREQDALLEGLGFRKVGLLFIWIKTTKDGNAYRMTGGLAGTRGNTEPCFLWRRGRPLKRQCASVRQTLEAPLGAHSSKPAEARRRLERLYGDVPRIELYARDRVPGWDAWGNQVPDAEPMELMRHG